MDTEIPEEKDFFPPPKRGGMLNVKLIFKGRSQSIPEESPWAEEDSGSG